MKTKKNPDIFDLALYGGLAIGGLVIFGALSSNDNDPKTAPSRGDASGQVSDGDGGYTQASVPSTNFDIVHLDWIPGGIYTPGINMSFTWTVNHVGPAGTYVVGVEMHDSNSVFGAADFFGLHSSDVVQSRELNINVNDDSAYRSYQVQGNVVYPGSRSKGIQLFVYVRDQGGNILAKFWTPMSGLVLG
jgi:hypothetical protein